MITYNGWTNYATWRVNLEMIDGIEPSKMGWHKLDRFDLADCLKEYCIQMLEEMGDTLVLSYALAFLSDVNWREIAEHMIITYAEEGEDNETV
jgi:hypothetical protein